MGIGGFQKYVALICGVELMRDGRKGMDRILTQTSVFGLQSEPNSAQAITNLLARDSFANSGFVSESVFRHDELRG